MNLFSLENLIITIFCLILAFFIARYAQNKAHRLWAYFNCAVALWAISIFLVGTSKIPSNALFFWKTAYVGASFIAVGFYHFVCAYYQLNRRILLMLCYAEAVIFSILYLITNLCVNDVRLTFGIYYHISNFYFDVWFIAWGLIVFTAFFEFYVQIKKDKKDRTPSLLIFWAMLVGFVGGASTTIPAYGIKIYPAFQIGICFYAILIGYGIFYHQLLPINIVIRRSIIYSILAALISLTYLLSVIISQQLFHQYFGYSSTLIGSFIIAIAFIPLKNKIQNFTDRFFLKATPMEIVHQNEKLKAVALLASGMAHEIKNPLTTLKTFSEYVPQKKDDPQFIEQYQKIIPQEIDRIDNLVHELLFFAKPSPPQMQTVNPNSIITNLIMMLEQKLKSFKIHASLQLNANTTIQADPNQLKQVLFNLILNAIDAMPNAGTLTITTNVFGGDKGTNNPQYTIEIADTGCGINQKDLPHIFEPFFTKKEKGTGLGLAISQGIIEKHGGKILVKSELGKGTVFSIFLNGTHAS